MMQKIEGSKELINEKVMNDIKNKICIAESKVLKTIHFDFEIIVPYVYLENMVKNFVNQPG